MTNTSLAQMGQASRALPGMWISEVVLQTGRYDELKSWYEAVLGQSWFFENAPTKPFDRSNLPAGDKQIRAADVRACFMRLGPGFPHGTTFALFELPWLSGMPTQDPGLNHMQFKNTDLQTLVKRLELMRDAGVHPHRSANHGPSLSFYFRDPDSNIVELCINNFDSAQEAQDFTRSDRFKANPSGLELDRDEFIARFYSGIPREALLAI